MGVFTCINTHMSNYEIDPVLGDYTPPTITPEELDVNEEVSATTRQKLSRIAKRTSKRRAILRKSRSRRRRNMTQLQKRARNEVKDSLRRKLTGKRAWKKISFSQRAQYDKAISRRKKTSDSLVKRIMPQVIRGESERLKRLNSSFEPVINNFINTFLFEAARKAGKDKTPEREPKIGTDKLKRKAQNRNNQRGTRQKTDGEIKSGDVQDNVIVIRNKAGELAMIDKKSLTKGQTVVMNADKATTAKLKSFLKNPSFVNTPTSEKLFGFVKGAEGSKKGSGKSEASDKPKKKKSSPSTPTPSAPPAPTIPATKKATKKNTFPTSHGAFEMEAGIAFAVNTSLGLTPEKIVSMGLMSKKDIDALISNPNESFMPSCQRAAQQVNKQYGGLYIKYISRTKNPTRLNKEAIAGGITDSTPKSDLILLGGDGSTVAGLSVKIGESQLSSGGSAETSTNLQWAMAQLEDVLPPEAKKLGEKFIRFFQLELSGNPRTSNGPVSLFQKNAARAGEDLEVTRREAIHLKATDMLNDLLNSDKKLTSAFIYALVTGVAKFNEGDVALATHVFSLNRDGTEAKITPVDMDYCTKLTDKVKFQLQFKSSAIPDKDVKKKWNEFKDRKMSMGQKITLEEDFRPYSFRTVMRSYLKEDAMSSTNLLKVVLEDSTDSDLKNIIPAEPQSPRDAINYLKDSFAYIGEDSFKLYQFFDDSVDWTVTEPIVDWTTLADIGGSMRNKIFINGKEHSVPVEIPYNYDDMGNMSSPLSEKRNYRQEYDNYHARPEQRANRSKRVLARRLMAKLGKVKKGDGKDVDHEDGNPQNNSKGNLRVRSKSANRSDN